MSFWTSIGYVRTGPPPVVTAGEVARFVRDIDATGLVKPSEIGSGAQIALGDASADDSEDLEDITCDLSTPSIERGELLEWLGHHSERPIRRMYVSLHDLAEPVRSAVNRTFEENTQALCLSSVSLLLDLFRAYTLDEQIDDEEFGWLSLCFDGPGYPYPRTSREIIAELTHCNEVRAATKCCLCGWPGVWAWAPAETG